MRISDWSSDVCSSDLGFPSAPSGRSSTPSLLRSAAHPMKRRSVPTSGWSIPMAASPCRARWNGVSNENRKARSEMLLDIRTYRVKPGRLKAHFEVYEKYGKPAQTRHLGQPLVYLRTETGDPNEYVHIWVYENAADRKSGVKGKRG